MDIGKTFNSGFGWSFRHFPYRNANKWLNIFTNPDTTIKDEIEAGTIRDGIKNITAAAIPMILLIEVISYFWLLPFSILSSGFRDIILYLELIPNMLVDSAFSFLLLISISLLTNSIIWIIAKIFGGQGTFGSQFYLMSLILCGRLISIMIMTLTLPLLAIAIGFGLGPLGVIPLVVIYLIVFLGIALYSLYLAFKVVRILHRVSGTISVLAVIVPEILLFIIVSFLAFFAMIP